jgi:hypothetical protein
LTALCELLLGEDNFKPDLSADATGIGKLPAKDGGHFFD